MRRGRFDALRRRGFSLHPRWLDPEGSPWVVLGISAAMFAAILGLRAAVAAPGDAALVLFLLPIGLCAIRFGLAGGVAAALVGFALLLSWEVGVNDELGAIGIAIRGSIYLMVGGLLGAFVDARRRLEAKLDRHYELAHDLIATATFDGYFEELNPAWERTLGHSRATLRARRFIEFVHPDDREQTAAVMGRMADLQEDAIGFRNRYRAADGGYLWLEWSCRPVSEERRIYAIARDVTAQREAERALQNQSDQLERSVRQRTRELEEARLEGLERLAAVAEYHDDDTHQHTERVGRAAALIARELGLGEETVALIRRAAPLHDIGKVGISEAILLKPGRLTAQEYEAVKEHVEIGGRILADGKFAVLRLARTIALTHHERWDGHGYREGLAGEAIPLSGRIVAVADAFDAITHDRPYKRARPVAEALEEIERCAGRQFDPRVVGALASLDHDRLLADVEDYDVDVPPPPLTSLAELT